VAAGIDGVRIMRSRAGTLYSAPTVVKHACHIMFVETVVFTKGAK
jgi:hypothetical protein